MNQINVIDRGICSSIYYGCNKLNSTDWLKDISEEINIFEIVEVRFKNTRKDFFRNSNQIKLRQGDIVAVESNPGHDVGIVSLTGKLVKKQMEKYRANTINGEYRKIYRKARQPDIDKWKNAISMEHETMIKSREIASDLGLEMKIGDVEYQGDCTKAIFYYIADNRVDFRELIKILAETFHIRVEMKQIGARQEAGRIGGIGSCGRELCCATWITGFVSVTTNTARFQEISLNPQKLAGQCGKLKCCLNYEIDSYMDARKDFPPSDIPLQTESGTYYFLKSDVFRGIYWYTSKSSGPSPVIGIPVERVKKIQEYNRKGKVADKKSLSNNISLLNDEDAFINMIGQDDINRFTQQSTPSKKRKGKQLRSKLSNNTPGNKFKRDKRKDRQR